MSIDLERFHKSFFEESFEGLDAMEQALLALNISAADAETINTIFRAAHSIKGGAATFGFASVAEYTHGVETLLDQMRSGKRQVRQADVDLLLRVVDVLRSLLGSARDGTAFDAAGVASTQAEISVALAGDTPAVAAAAMPAAVAVIAPTGWLIRFEPKPDLFRSGNDPLRIIRGLEALGELEVEVDVGALPSFATADAESCYLAWTLRLHGDATRGEVEELFSWVEDECRLVIEPLTAAGDKNPAPVEAATSATASADAGKPALALVKSAVETINPLAGVTMRQSDVGSIRVGTEKIDALINLVGELVITQAMLTQRAADLDPVQYEKLLNGLSQLDRNTRLLQEAVMATRMLPMEAVFSRFPRVVRDLAAKLNKQVRLVTVGEQTELDKSVIEKITDPLNHLVRNSLDHGLETAADRIARGKDATGTIKLSASHQGGNILIEVSDDGRGLDRARILAKAQEKGIVCSDTMSDTEVWQLIFAPGFSTAEKVTDVSGRGVGMDVVKRNIQALGGSVDLSSPPGSGTKVIIRLPLTLAILDGMSVAVGEDVYILPLGSVIESLQPLPEQVKRMAGQGTVVRVRNEYLPLMDLREWFGLPGERRLPHEVIVVIVESEGRKLAMQIDELVGQQQVVIKSLEANYRRVRGVSGATILGDGGVALILDIGHLVEAGQRSDAPMRSAS